MFGISKQDLVTEHSIIDHIFTWHCLLHVSLIFIKVSSTMVGKRQNQWFTCSDDWWVTKVSASAENSNILIKKL